jgi:hypothetical protein
MSDELRRARNETAKKSLEDGDAQWLHTYMLVGAPDFLLDEAYRRLGRLRETLGEIAIHSSEAA